MTRRFVDRTVLVTGASRGLGRAIALAFAGEGAWVAVGYHRRAADAEATLAAVREQGGDGLALALDVTDRPSVARAVAAIVEARGGIDVLVNNAGVPQHELFPMMSAETWDEVIAANLTGLFNVCRAVVRPMLARRRGSIVNIGSVSGRRAIAGQVGYAASKGGLVAFTAALGAELAPRGVRVNAVVPGLLSTGMAARLDARIVESVRAAIPLGRLGGAEEVARAVLFVASDAASYLVGQALAVDGGLSS